MVKEDIFGGVTACDHLNVDYEPAEDHVTCADCGLLFTYTNQTKGDEADAEPMPDVELGLGELVDG
jgi:hypothetical protein